MGGEQGGEDRDPDRDPGHSPAGQEVVFGVVLTAEKEGPHPYDQGDVEDEDGVVESCESLQSDLDPAVPDPERRKVSRFRISRKIVNRPDNPDRLNEAEHKERPVGCQERRNRASAGPDTGVEVFQPANPPGAEDSSAALHSGSDARIGTYRFLTHCRACD